MQARLRRFSWRFSPCPDSLSRSWFWTILLAALCGCADNSMVLKGKVSQFEQQQAALTRQNQELTARAAKLDQDNQELGKTVAQWQQQSKVLRRSTGGSCKTSFAR